MGVSCLGVCSLGIKAKNNSATILHIEKFKRKIGLVSEKGLGAFRASERGSRRDVKIIRVTFLPGVKGRIRLNVFEEKEKFGGVTFPLAFKKRVPFLNTQRTGTIWKVVGGKKGFYFRSPSLPLLTSLPFRLSFPPYLSPFILSFSLSLLTSPFILSFLSFPLSFPPYPSPFTPSFLSPFPSLPTFTLPLPPLPFLAPHFSSSR